MNNSNKEFEEWFKEQEERAIEEIGKMPELHDNFVLKNMCEAVWLKLYPYKERYEELESNFAGYQNFERERTLEAKVKELEISLEISKKAHELSIDRLITENNFINEEKLYSRRKLESDNETLEAKVKELEKLRYVPIAYGDKDKTQVLESLLIEACEFMSHSVEGTSKHWEAKWKFLDKPEIKKLLEGVKSE